MTDRIPWERDFWTPEPIFKGETVFCLASGPSLTQEVCDRIKGRRAIAINHSVTMAPWADVWFFTDNNIVFGDKDDPNGEPTRRIRRDGVDMWELVETFAGQIVTYSRLAKRKWKDRVHRIQPNEVEWLGYFPAPGTVVRTGRSSGHTAISLAVATSAAMPVLCGYDMRVVDNREHGHGEYDGRPRDLDIYEREFIPAFRGWYADGQKVGAEIVNATPGSALTEFPFVELDELLMRRAA